jgi:hypothetical protein
LLAARPHPHPQLLGIPIIYFALFTLDKSVMVDSDEDAPGSRRMVATKRMTMRLFRESMSP